MTANAGSTEWTPNELRVQTKYIERFGLELPDKVSYGYVLAALDDLATSVQFAPPCKCEIPKCADCPVSQLGLRMPGVMAKLRELYGVPKVELPAGVYAEPSWYQTTLEDGSMAYFQRRLDDCLVAAVATLLEVPPYLVPDVNAYDMAIAGESNAAISAARAAAMSEWLAGRGLSMHRCDVSEVTERRWIGVVDGDLGTFGSHCLLMDDSRVFFNPGKFLPHLPPKKQPKIDYAIVINNGKAN